MNSDLSTRMRDPRDFPVSYDIRDDAFCFSRIDETTLLSPFLDQRMGEAWETRTASPIPDFDDVPRAGPYWIFHTAFCCSTLLARALHKPMSSIVLKEPHALLDLATLSLAPAAATDGRLQRRVSDACRLLGRPWAPGGSVTIKPTNAVNRILPALLEASHGSRALLLHGSLEEFLYSCLKKLPGAEQPLRWMVQYLLPDTQLQRALGVPSTHAFNPVESAVLVWHAQMERYADALADDRDDRIRSLGMDRLLDNPLGTVSATAAWLGLHELNRDPDEARQRVDSVFRQNSKDTSARYDPEARARERDELRQRFKPVVDAALAWSAQAIAPHARLPVEWKPLLGTERAVDVE